MTVPLAADYPFLDVFWTIIVFFAWMAWLWIAITIFGDIFRRKDIGGWSKALWTVGVIILPFLGVLIYLLANHDGMAERNIQRVESDRAAFDDYVRRTAGGPAAEIAQAKQLREEGTITQAEFDAIKARATGGAGA